MKFIVQYDQYNSSLIITLIPLLPTTKIEVRQLIKGYFFDKVKMQNTTGELPSSTKPYEFTMRAIDPNLENRYKFQVRTFFLPIRRRQNIIEPRNQNTRLRAFPMFHKIDDHKIMPFYLECDQITNIHHTRAAHQNFDKQYEQAIREITVLKRPKPPTLYCSVCDIMFVDYIQHILTVEHQTFNRQNKFWKQILQICNMLRENKKLEQKRKRKQKMKLKQQKQAQKKMLPGIEQQLIIKIKNVKEKSKRYKRTKNISSQIVKKSPAEKDQKTGILEKKHKPIRKSTGKSIVLKVGKLRKRLIRTSLRLKQKRKKRELMNLPQRQQDVQLGVQGQDSQKSKTKQIKKKKIKSKKACILKAQITQRLKSIRGKNNRSINPRKISLRLKKNPKLLRRVA